MNPVTALQKQIDAQHKEVQRLEKAQQAALSLVKAASDASAKVVALDQELSVLLARQFKGDSGLTSTIALARDSLKAAEVEAERVGLEVRGAQAAADSIGAERDQAVIKLQQLIQSAKPAQHAAIKTEHEKLVADYRAALESAADKYLKAWALGRELALFGGDEFPLPMAMKFNHAPGAIAAPSFGGDLKLFDEYAPSEKGIDAAKREAREIAGRLATA